MGKVFQLQWMMIVKMPSVAPLHLTSPADVPQIQLLVGNFISHAAGGTVLCANVVPIRMPLSGNLFQTIV